MQEQSSKSTVTLAELFVDVLRLLVMVAGLCVLIAIYRQSANELKQTERSLMLERIHQQTPAASCIRCHSNEQEIKERLEKLLELKFDAKEIIGPVT